MPELEQALRTIGGNLEFPSTPDLTGAVRRRLAEGERRPILRRRALVIALAVLYGLYVSVHRLAQPD